MPYYFISSQKIPFISHVSQNMQRIISPRLHLNENMNIIKCLINLMFHVYLIGQF